MFTVERSYNRKTVLRSALPADKAAQGFVDAA
jgi:hypothetical protein